MISFLHQYDMIWYINILHNIPYDIIRLYDIMESSSTQISYDFVYDIIINIIQYGTLYHTLISYIRSSCDNYNITWYWVWYHSRLHIDIMYDGMGRVFSPSAAVTSLPFVLLPSLSCNSNVWTSLTNSLLNLSGMAVAVNEAHILALSGRADGRAAWIRVHRHSSQ